MQDWWLVHWQTLPPCGGDWRHPIFERDTMALFRKNLDLMNFEYLVFVHDKHVITASCGNKPAPFLCTESWEVSRR